MNKKFLGLGLTLAAVLLALAVLPQTTASATDTTPPTGSIVINDNKSCTNSRNVTIAMTWSDGTGVGVARMRFSNDGSTWTAYESLTASRSYQLPAGDGYKTVRVQFIDLANNRSATYSDYIRLDTVAPTGTIIINKGDLTTTKQSVTLGLTYADGTGSGVVRMRFSDNGSTWTNWMYPAATKAYKLPKADLGYQTVRVQYLDGANNYSPVYNDYIKLVADPTVETIMLPGSVPLVMKSVPAGTFAMGSPSTESLRGADEGPQHSVTFASGFWMGKFQVTKRQWVAVMGTTPWTSYTHVSSDLDSPAVGVSWDDIQSFVTALNALTGKTFHLPSEAQSEYTARAGTTTRFWWGDDPGYSIIDANAWYYNNCPTDQYAHVVGLKLPNAWGFYDMCGNVLEYCQDYYHDSYTGAPTDGSAWMSAPAGSSHVLHGGCFAGDWTYARSAHRSNNTGGHYFFGFRLVR